MRNDSTRLTRHDGRRLRHGGAARSARRGDSRLTRSTPKAPHFARQGQARHLPVPERRPVPGGHLRPQADARQVSTASRCPPATCRPSAKPATCCGRRSPSSNTARAASKSARSFPNSAKHADDLCVIRSMYTDRPNHEPSLFMMNCGRQAARPSVDGFVAHLRTRHRESESARLRRAVSRPAGDRSPALELDIPARRSTRAPIFPNERERPGQADRQHPQSGPDRRTSSAANSTCWRD